MKRLMLALALGCILAVSSVALAAAQPGPEFKLGFKALADQVPDVVGQPLENEHWGANGDSLQMTSNGLMAWRKADNWTAFTNGSRTWINGPAGVQERGNDERFEWENDQPPATAPESTATPVPATSPVEPAASAPPVPVLPALEPTASKTPVPASLSVPPIAATATWTPIPTLTARPTSTPWPTSTPYVAPSSGGSSGCCRVCRTGKACGNSCISRDKECHQPTGCACDG